MFSKTISNDFRRVLATNATTASGAGYTASPADTTTAPTFVAADSADGYIDLSFGDPAEKAGPDFAKFLFYGTGGDGKTGQCRVYGVVKVVKAQAAGVVSWTHVLLADFTFTLSAKTGVASGTVVDTEYYADTVGRTFGNANVSDQILSPADSSVTDVVGHALVDLHGFRHLKIVLAKGAANPATDVNALVAGY